MKFINELVNYLIDNGRKELDWRENLSTIYSWGISQKNCSLTLYVHVSDDGSWTASLCLFDETDEIDKYLEFDKNGGVR